jgi:hypothetical protein
VLHLSIILLSTVTCNATLTNRVRVRSLTNNRITAKKVIHDCSAIKHLEGVVFWVKTTILLTFSANVNTPSFVLHLNILQLFYLYWVIGLGITVCLLYFSWPWPSLCASYIHIIRTHNVKAYSRIPSVARRSTKWLAHWNLALVAPCNIWLNTVIDY